jgi:N-acetylmuramoyl-L-alanine amidase
MEVAVRSSPNFGPRRDGLRPELIVLHYTAMLTAEAALERLCDPAAEVSAHYLVAEDGRVWRLVEEAMRAWHAGIGSWRGEGDANSRSIGIELANAGPLAGFPPFPEPQMAALETLLDGAMARWAIPPAGVIGHSDLAPGRKADPGPKFDWRRLALGGRAVCPEPGGTGAAEWDGFRAAALAAGYGAAENRWDAVLDAVRLRFRPWATGELAVEDIAVLEAVVRCEGFIDRTGATI